MAEHSNSLVRRNEPVLDFISAVKGLHGQSLQELGRLIREAENNIIRLTTNCGLHVQIGVDRLVRFLALHLIATIKHWRGDVALFRYLLSGFQLLHSLCYLAPRPPKIEQIFVENTKVFEQIVDLILYLLTYLTGCRQDLHVSNPAIHLHSTLVATSLHLLPACVSSQWLDLTQALLLHSKVDMFMDVVFAAIRSDVKFLQTGLSAANSDLSFNSVPNFEERLNHLCQQCEASLQFLQSCCQQKCFRERLVKNKELCGKGGVLLLAKAVLDLNVLPDSGHSSVIVAAVSRMKSKVLSIVLHLCEAESVSYLDEVASNPETLDLGQSIALEVLNLLKTMFSGNPKQSSECSSRVYPRGQLQLNGLRLADIFSDDSNFRSCITAHFTEVLTTIFSLPHGEFLSSWCSSEPPVWEEDASLEYDPYAAAAWTLNFFVSLKQQSPSQIAPTFAPFNFHRESYAYQRTSLLVKVIANLHCFVPDICKEEKDLFLNKFLQCLQMDVPKHIDVSAGVEPVKAAIVNRNLSSLLSHAESLIPSFLNEEDLRLLREFINQVESHVKAAGFLENQYQVACTERYSPIVEATNYNNRDSNSNEDLEKTLKSPKVEQLNQGSNVVNQPHDVGQLSSTNKVNYNGEWSRDTEETEKNIDISGPGLSSTRGKEPIDDMVHDTPTKQGALESQREEKMETVSNEENHPKKRKRTIMNDKQIVLVEMALKDEPDLHRNAAALQLWAEKLSSLGCEVTPSQLKNWLNNRKARMSRVYRALSEADSSERQGGSAILPSYDPPGSTLIDVSVSSFTKGNQISGAGDTLLLTSSTEISRIPVEAPREIAVAESSNIETGKMVSLLDQNGNEIGRGKVFQAQGNWGGKNLGDSGICVVDIFNLMIDRSAKLPYPSEWTGTSFEQAKKNFGSMMVLWDMTKLVEYKGGKISDYIAFV
ncbi:OLC1v1007473C1 [Oldenlandia corymbosa var. corymbosa]|uniref:OLC1v1007473C1 n=1 Tax=Oldenlandia corymbosa var. corymbosa TaxID=529605 RepID=A0AAV1DJK4_OLDCO|nr:OLC1v1007473C1 [Oldenlandia corymbosa var. corymbosa]